MTSAGEEAAVVASAAALAPGDPIFSQYREHGALMWRGFSPAAMADQCFGAARDPGRGRQMPIHYGSRPHAFHAVSSPLATQLPHAAGAAYALKLEGRPSVAATYFGEGAASEGDFHAALNFAAVLKCPVVFICRNNGWAISTPAAEQYAGDGVAGRGAGYGVAAARVDGGDARAVHAAVSAARALALERSAPVLVEAMAYRAGHHSTSDDSSRYRGAEEMRAWRARDPAARLRGWLEARGWWSAAEETAARGAARREAIAALATGAAAPKPPLSSMFDDVYDVAPPLLEEQRAAALAHARRHPGELPPGVPLE
jgi:2-oxoisovalerate dehydrogenase E1 component alpha subunit